MERDAGIAGRRQNASPVRIGTGDGGLDQRRVGDGPLYFARLFGIFSYVNLNSDKFSRAFAISGYLPGKALHHRTDRRLKNLSFFPARSNR